MNMNTKYVYVFKLLKTNIQRKLERPLLNFVQLQSRTSLTFWRRIFFFKFQHTLYLKCE
jgi:hypothetical protein